MVVPRKSLFGEDTKYHFQGFRPASEVNYEARILTSYKWMRRGSSDSTLLTDAESNPDFKQPIAYSIVYNPKLKKVFVYKRAQRKEDYHETRLRGNWSWGFGGHIEKTDIDLSEKNQIQNSMLREITEEIKTDRLFNPRVIGYVNDDTPHRESEKIAVGQVHFGILYLVQTDALRLLPKDPEIASIDPKSLIELEEICAFPDARVESWSRIAIEPLRLILK